MAMARGEPSKRIYWFSPPTFPSSDELEAAESLMLFSLLPVTATKACHSSSGSSSSNSPSDEISLSRSSITDSLSSGAMEAQIQPDPLNILSIAASLHLIDTKVEYYASSDPQVTSEYDTSAVIIIISFVNLLWYYQLDLSVQTNHLWSYIHAYCDSLTRNR